MTPTTADRERAEKVAEHVLFADCNEAIEMLIAQAIADARAEERERCASLMDEAACNMVFYPPLRELVEGVAFRIRAGDTP